jgi:CheY-like chemotaxis protein
VERAAFEVVLAGGADEAIAILETRDDILVIFTDINMPGSIDGLKLAHAVRGCPIVRSGNHCISARSYGSRTPSFL